MSLRNKKKRITYKITEVFYIHKVIITLSLNCIYV